MNTITLATAKRDFEIGYITRYKIERAVMRQGWTVHVISSPKSFVVVDARTGTPRIIKSLDAAVKTLESIGFEVNELG